MSSFGLDYPSLVDPAGSGSLVAAVAWIQGTLLGTIATTIAVISVASVGLGMLAGRVDIKRGVTVILGCFVLFGASGIVAGVRGMMADRDTGERVYSPTMPISGPAPLAVPRPPPTPSPGYDPYSGASVPFD